MDSSKSIGLSWNSIAPVRTPEVRKTGTPAPAVEPSPATVAGDHLDLSGFSPEVSLTPSAAAAAPAAPATVEREAVPVHLREDDLGGGLLGGLSSRENLSSVASLGLLAQLDEAAPIAAVRAVDGPSQPNAFADLHLVGPSSAARFLANPSELYVGM